MAFARVLLVIPLFAASILGLHILVQNAPFNDNQCRVKIPKSMADVTELNLCFKKHYDNHYLYMIALFSTVYIIKQAFCIPGSVLLNLIAGSMFGSGYGTLLVCALSSIGVFVCYILSKVCGIEKCLMYYFPSMLTSSKRAVGTLVQNNRHQLWYLLLVLRVIPITPNWLLNLFAPVFEIPLWTFIYSTFFGLMPYNYICCQSGQTLSSITSLEEIFTFKITLQLTSIAVAMVILKITSKFCKLNT